MGSRLGLTARTTLASSTSDDNINLSCVPIGRAYTQNLQINVVHHTAEMENGFICQLRLLPHAYAFSPFTEEGMYLKQVPLDLSTLNARPAASWLFTIEDKTEGFWQPNFLCSLFLLPWLSRLIWKCSCASVWLDSIIPVKSNSDPVWLGCSILNGT